MHARRLHQTMIAPFQAPGGDTIGNPFVTTSNQTFNAFLGEPRTFGVTLKGRF